MENEIEEWRSIPGLIHYEASSFGRIRSLDRIVKRIGPKGPFKSKGMVLKLMKHNAGYLMFNAMPAIGSTPVVLVHRAVALAFIPNPIGLPQVNHLDGVGMNNLPENLEWTTGSRNLLHAFRILKRRTRGPVIGPRAKLCRDDIPIIRTLKSYISVRKIASLYSMSTGCIWAIMNNKSWRHVISTSE